MKIVFSILTLFLISSISSFSQELTSEELKLYNLIMEYRKSYGLPEIPISKSLTFVAQIHVRDLMINRPDTADCNLHSWSNKGNWRPCCYTSNHAKSDCMWEKPRELTKYNDSGFEIAAYSGNYISAQSALDLWKNSHGHNDVILNKNKWKKEWKAIGIGIYGNYAVVWFGYASDK
jgi:uncharacterized protein YkwD